MQDVSGGRPVEVEGTDGQLFGMEVDVEAAKAELREISAKDEGQGASKFLKSIGLGAFAEQLDDLKLGTSTPLPLQESTVGSLSIVSTSW